MNGITRHDSAVKALTSEPGRYQACHWAKDPESDLLCFIPGCRASIGDPAQCTCRIQGSRLDQALAKLSEAEETIRYLRTVIKSQNYNKGVSWRRNERLHAEVKKLRATTVQKGV